MAEAQLDLSVVIITLNEERHLRRCLASLPSTAEIIVLDSYSTDKTTDIAREFGAKVFSNTFVDYASQKNAAIGHASRTWVLSLDADETIDARMAASLVKVCTTPQGEISAFSVRRKLVFMQRVMNFGKTKDFPLRVFKREHGQFAHAIHERFVVRTGKTSRLRQGTIFHHSYDNLSDYFAKFNLYTSRIAENHFKNGRHPALAGHVLRPWTEFFSRYFLRLGFLDGYPGYCYALVSSTYAFVKYAKLKELYLSAPK